MRQLLTALMIAAFVPAASAAEDKRPALKPMPKQSSGNPCAIYGPGFVQVEGSSTCVRLGGAIDIGAGVSSRR